MPGSILDQVSASFDNLADAGKQGSELVKITQSAIHQMSLATMLFEQGQQSPVWRYNFSTFAGEEGSDTAIKILMIFKNTLEQLKNIPLENVYIETQDSEKHN